MPFPELYNMEEITIEDLKKYKNKKLEKLFNKFINYNNICRDLKEAIRLISLVINYQKRLLNHPEQLQGIDISVYSAYKNSSVVLYARWFKKTKGKTSLGDLAFTNSELFKANAKNSVGSVEEFKVIHEKLLTLRDKYIVHKELDDLSMDTVHIGNHPRNTWKVHSFWNTNNLGSLNENEEFRNCYTLVLEIIDKDILVNVRKNLEEELRTEGVIK